MTFHPLTLFDREAMQAVTLRSGRRNCNYTFANLVGWQFWYYTEVCVLENAVVLRYNFDGAMRIEWITNWIFRIFAS